MRDEAILLLEDGVERDPENVVSCAHENVDARGHLRPQIGRCRLELDDQIETLVVEWPARRCACERADTDDSAVQSQIWKCLEADDRRLTCANAVHFGLADRALDHHSVDLRNRDESLAVGHAIANSDLPARKCIEVLVVYNQARMTCEEAAAFDELLQQFQPRLCFLQPRARVADLRLLLHNLQRGTLLVARMRHLDDDVGAFPREAKLLFGLLECFCAICRRVRVSSTVSAPSPSETDRTELSASCHSPSAICRSICCWRSSCWTRSTSRSSSVVSSRTSRSP